ncbi:MAG TPA: hypothetical protein VF103_05455, partial [Polyangiaceae bacterium]
LATVCFACNKPVSSAERIAPESLAQRKAAEPPPSEPAVLVRRDESLAVPSAAPDPAPEKERASVGWIELTLGNERKRLAGPCQDDWRDAKQPYVEVIDPNTASPRVILTACGSDGVYFDIVGNALKLPGKVTPMELRIMDIKTHEDWKADNVEFDVTEFGAPGKPIAGTFRGTMSARLNRDPVPIRGTFRVVRAPDRYAP